MGIRHRVDEILKVARPADRRRFVEEMSNKQAQHALPALPLRTCPHCHKEIGATA